MIKGLGRRSRDKDPISQPGVVNEGAVGPLTASLKEGPLRRSRPGRLVLNTTVTVLTPPYVSFTQPRMNNTKTRDCLNRVSTFLGRSRKWTRVRLGGVGGVLSDGDVCSESLKRDLRVAAEAPRSAEGILASYLPHLRAVPMATCSRAEGARSHAHL